MSTPAKEYRQQVHGGMELAKGTNELYAKQAMAELAEEFTKAAEQLERYGGPLGGHLPCANLTRRGNIAAFSNESAKDRTHVYYPTASPWPRSPRGCYPTTLLNLWSVAWKLGGAFTAGQPIRMATGSWSLPTEVDTAHVRL
jgi:hypothetical protein